MFPLILSAPFGNYLSWPGVTRTRGTFTLHARGGVYWRLWRVLWTLRPTGGGGWINALGLPNPGIRSRSWGEGEDEIVSIRGLATGEWMALVEVLGQARWPGWIELNLSCPNVTHRLDVALVTSAIAQGQTRFGLTRWIAKLPPLGHDSWVVPLWSAGVRCFHACNTLPVRGGGLCGPLLLPHSLRVVSALKDRHGEAVRVIGGGGVRGWPEVALYLAAGADHIAIASLLLAPLSWWKVAKLRNRLARKGG